MRRAAILLALLSGPATAAEPYQPLALPPANLPAAANKSARLFVPEVTAGQTYPLVIYLHGAGAKGTDNAKPVTELLPALLVKPDLQKRFPCFVLVPQCPDGDLPDGRPKNWVQWAGQKENPPAKWETADAEPSEPLRGAMLALDAVLAKHPIDPARIYLTGVSMGGSGACNWAAREPHRFAGVIAACCLSETAKAKPLAKTPLRLYHGSDDPVAPIERSRTLAAAVKAAGGDAELIEFTGAGHGIANQTFRDHDYAAVRWLFAQRKVGQAFQPDAKPRSQAGKPDAKPRSQAGKPDLRIDHFEKKVRPLLLAHCVECHGEKKQKGGLRLDSRAAALAGGDIGPAVVPGQPDESLLVAAVRYGDDLQMPPKGKLPAAAIADLTEWVKRGAVWPSAADSSGSTAGPLPTDAGKSHWAFQPIRDPTPPTVAGATTDIDRFLRAKQQAAGLTPAPPADARTLARRLSFTLTGLPPTPERVAAFETSYTQDADAAVAGYVAELLASPRYGERFGRHWLDVARYADSNGSEIDHAMANAWRYRDYVIGAFNADVPFDRFLREQVAGDLLGTPDGLVASGFLLFGPKALAELDKEKFVLDVIDEQIDTIGKAFLGLTLGCARCHDHKFDPVTAVDYYALAGIFKSTRSVDTSRRVATWTERPLAGVDPAKADALAKRVAELRAERERLVAASKGRKVLDPKLGYLLVEAEDFKTANVRIDRDMLGKGIGVVRTRMEYPDQIEYEFEVPAAGVYQLELRYAAKESRPTHLLLNGNLEDMDAAAEVTGDWQAKAQRWFLQGRYTLKHGVNTLAFRRDGPVPLFDKWLIGVPLEGDRKHSDTVGQAFQPDSSPAKPQIQAGKPDLRKIDAAIAAAEAEREKVPAAMAPTDGPGTDHPVLVRGNPTTPGPTAPRGVPTFLNVPAPVLPAGTSGRQELADWMTHPANPLTARVIVNRIWGWHFGEGLVRSPDNFGLRGEAPSHPELLDYLAARFVADGWSVKKLNALICTTAAYRQASGMAADADPENRLLAVWPRQRLAAEQLRDAMLAVGGRLDLSAGGSLMEVMNRTYATGGNAPPDVVKRMHYDAPRRAVYLPVVRNAVYDLFAAFDFPEPGTVTGRRDATTVAPQALFLMNSPFVKQQATALAARVATAADDRERLTRAYELVLSRPPRKAEVAAALAFLDTDAAALTTAGNADPRASALGRLCHALLVSNEFLYLR